MLTSLRKPSSNCIVHKLEGQDVSVSGTAESRHSFIQDAIQFLLCAALPISYPCFLFPAHILVGITC